MRDLATWLWRLSGPALVVVALLFVAVGAYLPEHAATRHAASVPVATPRAIERCVSATAPAALAGRRPRLAAELVRQGLLPPVCHVVTSSSRAPVM